MKLKCYCGKSPKIGHNHEGYYVKCSCGEKINGFDSKSEAKSEWILFTKILTMARNNIPPTEWERMSI